MGSNPTSRIAWAGVAEQFPRNLVTTLIEVLHPRLVEIKGRETPEENPLPAEAGLRTLGPVVRIDVV